MLKEVIQGLARFEFFADAVNRVEEIRSSGDVSRQFNDDGQSFALWVRGFEVTEDELKQGYRGNFCRISVIRKNGEFVVFAKKIPCELQYHPERQRPKHPWPNLGHPVIRKAGKKNFKSADQARRELRLLRSEFSNACWYDSPDRLLVNIWSRKFEPKPIKSHVLEVVPSGDGSFRLKLSEYVREAKKNHSKVPPSQPVTELAELAIYRLRLEDEREIALIRKLFLWIPARSGEREICSICLIRPGTTGPGEAVQKLKLWMERGPELRLYRIPAQTSEWVAVATRSFHDLYKRLVTSAWFLTLDSSGEWVERENHDVDFAGPAAEISADSPSSDDSASDNPVPGDVEPETTPFPTFTVLVGCPLQPAMDAPEATENTTPATGFLPEEYSDDRPATIAKDDPPSPGNLPTVDPSDRLAEIVDEKDDTPSEANLPTADVSDDRPATIAKDNPPSPATHPAVEVSDGRAKTVDEKDGTPSFADLSDLGDLDRMVETLGRRNHGVISNLKESTNSFGFIVADSFPDIFFLLDDFPENQRVRVRIGCRIAFTLQQDEQGRFSAKDPILLWDAMNPLLSSPPQDVSEEATEAAPSGTSHRLHLAVKRTVHELLESSDSGTLSLPELGSRLNHQFEKSELTQLFVGKLKHYLESCCDVVVETDGSHHIARIRSSAESKRTAEATPFNGEFIEKFIWNFVLEEPRLLSEVGQALHARFTTEQIAATLGGRLGEYLNRRAEYQSYHQDGAFWVSVSKNPSSSGSSHNRSEARNRNEHY